MSYPASIEKALAYLQTKDIPKGYRKHPWFYRWLWKKGIEIPPPLLSGFFTNMLIFGLICGFVTALTIFLLMERNTWSFPADFLLRWATLGIGHQKNPERIETAFMAGSTKSPYKNG